MAGFRFSTLLAPFPPGWRREKNVETPERGRVARCYMLCSLMSSFRRLPSCLPHNDTEVTVVVMLIAHRMDISRLGVTRVFLFGCGKQGFQVGHLAPNKFDLFGREQVVL